MEHLINEPRYHAPATRPDWHAPDALDKLKEHLQTAVVLELHTIPLYLFAAYSVKDNGFSAHKFLTVVRQEMLHLALAGNVLRAIGGRPKVYGREFTPVYPVKIFYDQTVLNLRAATRENVATFAKVERPGPPILFSMDPHILQTYGTIGEFYQATLDGLRIAHEEHGDKLFRPDSLTRQFQTADGSWYDEDMTVVSDIKSANAALTVVIEQGEGSHGQPVRNTVQSHFEVFIELLKYPLECYPVIENPITAHYERERIYKVMIASDAAYSYLLLTLEEMWVYDGPRRRELVTNNITSLMMDVLKPLALFLVTQQLNEKSNAAAPFNFFEFKPIESAYTQLKTLMDTALAEYPNVREVGQAQRAVNALLDLNKL